MIYLQLSHFFPSDTKTSPCTSFAGIDIPAPLGGLVRSSAWKVHRWPNQTAGAGSCSRLPRAGSCGGKL
jgi:hypothetical protein